MEVWYIQDGAQGKSCSGNQALITRTNTSMKSKKKKAGTRRLPTQVRRAQILRSALEIMATRGYSNFTLRNIASSTGIHFATLQYHFKSKNELLDALIQWKLKEDHDLLAQTVAHEHGSPRERFCAGIKLVAGENRKSPVVGFFLQLWALAGNDKNAARAIAELYSAYRDWLADLVGIARPDLDERSRRLRALPIMAMLEGMLPTMTLHKDGQKSNPAEDQLVADAAWAIATQS